MPAFHPKYAFCLFQLKMLVAYFIAVRGQVEVDRPWGRDSTGGSGMVYL